MRWIVAAEREEHRSQRRWSVLAVLLLLIAAGSVAANMRGYPDRRGNAVAPHVGSASPSGSAHPAPSPALAAELSPARKAVAPTSVVGSRAAPRKEVPAKALARSAPVFLRIPSIGVAVPVSGLALNRDGTVEVPTDFKKPGWFRLGPSPGQMGSAVILGHVDSYRGPAVFFRLRYLRDGDRVDVTLADGWTAHFVANSVQMYPKTQFPAQQVYGPHGYSALQLVTCGGEFDTQRRSYKSNVVVYTSLAAATPPAR